VASGCEIDGDRGRRSAEEFECLPEEVGTVDDRSGEIARLEIEGHDLVSGHTVEVAVWAEPQASGVAEEDRPVSSEDPYESAAGAVVLANARNGVAPAEGPFAGHHNVAVRRHGEIKGAQLRIFDQAWREEMAVSIEYLGCVFADARRAHARRQEHATIGSECKPPWEWDDLWRKVRNGGSVQTRRHSHDGAETTGAQVVAPIGSEHSCAGVELVDRAGVLQDLSLPVYGEHAIVTVVDVEQVAAGVDAQSARVSDTAVVTERSQRGADDIEGEDGSVSCAVRALSLENEESHLNDPPSGSCLGSPS
jgi:hypothetical protein